MVDPVDSIAVVENQAKIFENGNNSICTNFCQATFLDYHSNSKDSKIVSQYLKGSIEGNDFVFPYNVQNTIDRGTKVFSHSGSPYGGLCIDSSSTRIIKLAYEEIIAWIKNNIKDRSSLEVRLPPAILSDYVSAHEWSLWSLGFQTEVMYLGRYFKFENNPDYNRNRKRRLSKLLTDSFDLERMSIPNEDAFEILIKNRLDRHSSLPIHTISDFEKIEELNPGVLATLLLSHEGNPCSVAIIFKDKNFNTLQYLAGSECSFNCGSQDYLVDLLIQESKISKQFLLMGTSTIPVDGHRELNDGLDAYKTSFGGLPYKSDRFVLSIQ